MNVSVRTCAKVAGALYAVCFATGTVALLTRGEGIGAPAGAIAGLSYVLVTIVLFTIYAPAGRALSALAAGVSLGGIALGAFAPAVIPGGTPLPVFGVYCLLLGILTWRSSFLPRWIAGALFLAGAGWLTFLAGAVSPVQYVPGIVGEGVFMLWLLVKGVDAERWNGQAGRGAKPEAVVA